MELILSFLFIGIVIYLADKYFFNYWNRRGVKQIDGSFLIGNFKDLVLLRQSFGVSFKKIYDATKKERFVGVYFSYRPALLVNDLKLIKDIMIKDFTSFHDRGVYVDEKNDILSGHLFSLGGQKWRDLRVKLSPTFTSGKLKGMFPVMIDCANVLENYIEKQVNSKNCVMDIRDLAARFTTNIISSVAFGIEIDSINEPNHIFRVMGRRLFQLNFKNGLRYIRTFMFPRLKIFKNFKAVDDDVEKFFVDLVRDTIDYREKNDIKRNDFMQLMIQLKNEGYESVDRADEKKDDDAFEYFKDKSLTGSQKITFEELCAQAFVFYIAGMILYRLWPPSVCKGLLLNKIFLSLMFVCVLKTLI
jgi:cytochrome P450 family 6